MKTITVPPSPATFRLEVIEPLPGRVGVVTEVEVYDSINSVVAVVATYRDGSAETVWRSDDDPYVQREDVYADYDEQWWQGLCAAVAKAVAQ